MTPLSHTRASVRLVQDRLRGWLEARLVEAEAGKEPRVGLHALRVSVGGRSGDAQGLPLLTLIESTREAPAGVPAAWAELARAMVVALEPMFPRVDPRPGPASRPRPAPAVDALPAPLAAWYRARMAESDAWTWRLDSVTLSRPPTLGWRAPLSVRLAYLVSVDKAGEDALPLLTALSAAMAYDNSFDVQIPALPHDPTLSAFVRALAASVPEAGPPLLAALERIGATEDVRASISPSSDLGNGQLLQYAAAIGQPSTPYLQIAVGVNVGADAQFGPAVVPTYAGRSRRPGEPE